MDEEKQRSDEPRFSLSEAEQHDIKLLLRYALVIGSAVAVTLLIVMVASSFFI